MDGTWQAWGGVVVVAIGAIPVAGVAAWWLARWRGWRVALCDVGMVTGTAPWLWMILTPNGTGRSVNLVPLHDLAEQLADGRVIEQFGGNLLVFAALGFLLPVRWSWFARSFRILLVGAAASITVETVQFTLAIGRHSSVDDVLLNAAGACLASQLSRPWLASHTAGVAGAVGRTTALIRREHSSNTSAADSAKVGHAPWHTAPADTEGDAP
ncbi:VanZ family protein [Nocardia iowensis]|uniref:VanZ family protein n=1 Tax=Nocardia iowensis TaxID=204891 RepID=A0ABX8S0C7_NOCIO|nr:VanZ family protein [Nocardia iowensis]